MTNLGFCQSWCTSRAPQKTFYVINTQVPFSFTDLTNRYKDLHVISNQSGVEGFLGALDKLHGNFNDIGAHQDSQKPNFVVVIWSIILDLRERHDLWKYQEKISIQKSSFYIVVSTVWSNQIGTVRKRTLLIRLQLMNNIFKQVLSKN